ncbi:type I restriction-modification system subunit M [Mesomycoplasma neurolyticum]|uniref:site-specific DNA-methyltransferase (adenine-specific) n=1 Tax=Mesomycoplasma neurolyticum TaxID=2120 RepID=A0A449A4F1_9BACT|nr:class I SAM-dependent DNA methyltransferase [Mesomycoplasma neurolyticum]VEU59116.1 Probable type I restriction enzyme BthVORF4518P M protein [Mesomycoplasma neurolyticum]VEU59767.1 Probable type I restriction enzyme BthVORF4518P M protein [Mesomycoplasma neurolyticum]VEU59860.1 Probable type I restriction enzyme BthVORF4518P M protein [Mesomycoplasma neurolyticum]VEU59906.1 Probable type I restriction enzyme BthVORF4518P M protein [Mesomycoplasma neurolyticum]
MSKQNIEINYIDSIKEKLWKSCDEMRGNVPSEQYMHIIIAIIFLKAMSDKYEKAGEQIRKKYLNDGERKWLLAKKDLNLLKRYDVQFIVPESASWSNIQKYISKEEIGIKIDEALLALEEQNNSLKGLFEKNFSREDLDKQRLSKVIKQFSDINFSELKEDFIGRLYEYFLGNFFRKQGQNGGEFYTPQSIVELMVALLAPDSDSKIYDPACGTGGMFVQAKKYLEKHKKDITQMRVYGQEFSSTTWKLAKINLILNGFDPDDTHLGSKAESTFKEDLSGFEQFDIVLANPPFNLKIWENENASDDPRYKWGLPPTKNANYAWLSHILYKLNENGRAAVILANGALSSSQKEELSIRKKMLEENKIEAIISLPDKLFYTTGIPATIWIFNNNKLNDDVIFINAENLGELATKKLRVFNTENINEIVSAYNDAKLNKDFSIKGFAKRVSLNEIKENDYSLVPGRYIDLLEEEVDKEQLKAEILEIQNELKILFKEFTDLIPDVEKSIEQAIKFADEQEKEK